MTFLIIFENYLLLNNFENDFSHHMRENLTSQQLRELHVSRDQFNWDFFWDHFCNFLGLCSYFHENFGKFETFWSACISTYTLFVKNSKKIEFLSALSHCLGPIFAQLDPLFKIFGSPIDCGTVVTPWTGAEANSAIFRQATNGEDETRRD